MRQNVYIDNVIFARPTAAVGARVQPPATPSFASADSLNQGNFAINAGAILDASQIDSAYAVPSTSLSLTPTFQTPSYTPTSTFSSTLYNAAPTAATPSAASTVTGAVTGFFSSLFNTATSIAGTQAGQSAIAALVAGKPKTIVQNITGAPAAPANISVVSPTGTRTGSLTMAPATAPANNTLLYAGLAGGALLLGLLVINSRQGSRR